ncbi:MAG: dihydrodipicolinate synthase family protein [Blastocatellia bacterium]|nr:MAG: dihydrodipicolinate synthase family protein [Blastocatellia bacterium]
MMNLSGVLTPIPTPFDDCGDVDLAKVSAALTRWLVSPLTGFVILGTNGEAVLLDETESDRMIDAARTIVPSDRWFIVGTGRESTRATLAATRRAASLGADAVLVRTPGFFKAQMTAQAFVRHYSAVADESPVPILLYNFTAVTGVTLPVEAVAQLAAHPNVIGMKESGGDILRLSDLAAVASPGFALLAGSVANFHAALCRGAAGGILALASVLPFACTRVFELTRTGRDEEARALEQQLLPIGKLVGSNYGIPGLKAALKLVGCDVGTARPPLLPLDDAVMPELADALSAFDEAHGHVAS